MRRSTTRYAIMAMLTIQPMSGYDVRKAFESIGGFWHESHGQIYPTLKKLVAEGLVEQTVERQDGKPDRHLHELTAAGKDALQTWLREPAVPMRLRDELLFKLFFGNLLEKEDAQQQLAHYQARMEHDLAFYTQLAEQLQTLMADSLDMPYRLMTVRYGIATTKAGLEWCTECLQTLHEMT